MDRDDDRGSQLVSEDADLAPGGGPGSSAGGGYTRIRREELGTFRRGRRGHLVATEKTAAAGGGPATVARQIKIFFTGRPLDTEALDTERMPIWRALPILSSDALSSVAYGPEAGLAVLATAGAGALLVNVPIGIAIALLMVIVTTSYRQVVRGYPSGGGSYAVARANLGVVVGLVAAAALLVDYVLTVAVSVSSGVDALASAFTVLSPYKVLIGLAFVALLMVGNLRGVREAGVAFAGPTYLFVVGLLTLVAAGLVGGLVFGRHPVGHYAPIKPETSLGPLLVLTAFASGASSMTGIEAVSNSVPAFHPPEAKYAARTLAILGGLLVTLFLGVVALDVVYGAEPNPSGTPTVLSQLASVVFQGPGRPLYYGFQFVTLLVLVLAANTSFNGFPRLSAVLARDHHLPHRFAQLGDRLVYSTGIVLLAVAAGVLIVAFGANTNALIDLYALGVFVAFTLAQTGMARHWWRARGRGWVHGFAINAGGGAITAIVGAVIIITKAPRGAWVVLILIPALVLLLWSVARYYARVRAQLPRVAEEPQEVDPGPAVVPVVRLDSPTRAALRYAMALSEDVVAVHLARRGADAAEFAADWKRWSGTIEGRPPALRSQPCPRGGRVHGFLSVLDSLQSGADRLVTVVLPEWESRHLVHDVLARPQAALFKLALLRRPDVVAASIPAPEPEVVQMTGRAAGPHPERVAIVPVANPDAPARRALAYAGAVASKVIVVHVETRADEPTDTSGDLAGRLASWTRAGPTDRPSTPTRLVIIDSPYRSIVPPILAYVDSWRRAHPEPICTVVLPELVTVQWWAHWLHNHRAFWIKTALLSRATVAVADVTYHLR
jgi:amino acid transporter